MKYIIMAGGNYSDKFTKPKQLLKVNGEVLIERTIRLLKENGINDIAISTNISDFDYLGVEILRHKNNYIHGDYCKGKKSSESWLNAYYPMKEPCCYLHGDVYFSEDAIKKIIETDVKETMFFCVRDTHDGRKAGINTKGREPLAYKVNNQEIFRNAINELFAIIDEGGCNIDPISWNLYRQINHLQQDFSKKDYGFANDIFKTKGDYVAIDDYTTDIDKEADIEHLERLIRISKGGEDMVKVEVLEKFYYGKFNEEVHNLVRSSIEVPNTLIAGDVFECREEVAKYLGGENAYRTAFVRVIEVIPAKEEAKEEVKEEVKKPIKKSVRKTTRKSTKKTIEKKA